MQRPERIENLNMTGIERYSSTAVFSFVVRAAGFLPWKAAQILGQLIGELAFFLSAQYRKITFKNLRLVFGKEMTQKQITGIARRTYINFGKSFCETASSVRFSGDGMKKLVKLNGRENLEKALKKGRGIIGFSAHIGNFGLMGMRLAAEGYPFSFILRDPEVGQVARGFRQILEPRGVGTIPSLPRRKAIISSLKCLHRNEIVCILGDQREIQSGIFIDFMGHTAGTAIGPVVLAIRSGASIVPMFSIRTPADENIVMIEPAYELIISGDRERDIRLNTIGLTGIVERYIRQYPSQWLWLHRRWKLT